MSGIHLDLSLNLNLIPDSLPNRLYGIPGFDPGSHAAVDVVHMSVSQVGQRFGGNVTTMAGLAIDDDVVIQFGANLSMARFDHESRYSNPCPG